MKRLTIIALFAVTLCATSCYIEHTVQYVTEDSFANSFIGKSFDEIISGLGSHSDCRFNLKDSAVVTELTFTDNLVVIDTDCYSRSSDVMQKPEADGKLPYIIIYLHDRDGLFYDAESIITKQIQDLWNLKWIWNWRHDMQHSFKVNHI